MGKLKVIISGGGTGGHIFPALSIANELKTQLSDVDILFVGALGKMEMERIPAAGYPIIGLPVMGLPRKASLKMFRFIWMLFKSMQKAKRVIKDFNPDVAIGVGGFASGPVLKAAVKKAFPQYCKNKIPMLGSPTNCYPQRFAKYVSPTPTWNAISRKRKLF